MHADALATPRWHRVSEYIADHTGLHFPPERRTDLWRALGEAAPELGFRDVDSCADWLLSSPLSSEDLRKLARYLTVGETYFFRERPSFNALASHVLPVLIHRKRAVDRRLRLWSAACSTGEEAYSLAMLVQQVLPDWRDWSISILATDINPQSLRKAEAAEYGEWSFRESGPEFRARYFVPARGNRYRLREDVRRMVSFSELNLATDGFPSLVSNTQAMDVILCRNLLIYFTPAHATRLIGKLRRALVDEGWLIVSPSECSQTLFNGFTAVNFPGSVLYRKGESSPPAAPLAGSGIPAPMTACDPSLAPRAILDISEPPRSQPAPAGSSEPVPAPDSVPVTPPGPAVSPSLGATARLLADQGALAEALAASETWIAADKLDAAAHYVQAMVQLELGNRAGARAALQRALYLDADFPVAYFALGNLARAEARTDEARRHFTNAAQLLRKLPADGAVPESEGMTAGRLLEIINALLVDK